MDVDGLARRTGANLSPLTPADPPTVGSWRLLARLPFGGLGRVYVARHATEPSGFVVVKLLKEQGEKNVARLQREIDNARLVTGPQVAQVIGFGRRPEQHLVQEFVPGPQLQQLIDDADGASLPTVVASTIATQLLQALVRIHAAEVVHRDLKPSNIILNNQRGPVVIDFGISHLRGDVRLTTGDFKIGTAAYMSRERLAGHGDEKADVFSWGVIAAQMFSGHHPFDPHGTCHDANAYAQAIDTRAFDVNLVPGVYQRVVAAALAADPERRPDAAHLLTRMDAIARDPGIRANLAPLDSGGTRADWLARLRGIDPAQFLRALRGIREESEQRPDRDRKELLHTARTATERLAVRLHLSRQAALLARRSVRLVLFAAAGAAGLVGGAFVSLALNVLWVSLT